MQRLLEHIVLQLDPGLYQKDPFSSPIGKLILKEGVKQIAHDGLDVFTFKKLATALNSTETTIYRYFTNKHQMIMYLSSWYWSLLEWRIVFATANINDPKTRLQKAIHVLTSRLEADANSLFVDEQLLQDIVNAESYKGYEIHWAKPNDKKGYYLALNSLIDRLAQIIHEADKTNKHPRALALTFVETTQRQSFYAKHLHELTDVGKSQKSLEAFLLSLIQLK